MSARVTLGEAKESSIPQATGLLACDERFVTYLNEAQRRLGEAGEWWGTYQRMRICVTKGCIVWPSEVKVVRGMNACKNSLLIRNAWFEFQETIRAPALNYKDCNGSWQQSQLLDRGTTPLFREFIAGSKIRIYPTDPSDDGKLILIQGTDLNNNVIRTEYGGQWVTGEYLPLNSPFVESNYYYNSVVGVQKVRTNERVTVFAYDSDTGEETQIAVWGAYEKNPAYRKTYLTMLKNCTTQTTCEQTDGCETNDCDGQQIEAIVRLEFTPAYSNTDWLFISSIEAIKHEMKAILAEDSDKYDEAARSHNLAIRKLREQLNAYSPQDEVIVNVETAGLAPSRRVFGGFW